MSVQPFGALLFAVYSVLSVLHSSPRKEAVGANGTSVSSHLRKSSIDRFRRNLPNKICVRYMPADDFLHCAAIAGLSFNKENCFSLFDNPLFPAIGASDRKPICANRQLLFKECATDLARLISGVKRDVVNPHDWSQRAQPISYDRTSFGALPDQSERQVWRAWSLSTCARKRF